MTESPNPQSLASLAAQLEACADHAALDGYYGLQDACLLISEALVMLEDPSAISTHLLTELTALPVLIAAYPQQPTSIAAQIIAVICHAELNIPLSGDELEILATSLTCEEDTASPEPITPFAATGIVSESDQPAAINRIETANTALIALPAQAQLTAAVEETGELDLVQPELDTEYASDAPPPSKAMQEIIDLLANQTLTIGAHLQALQTDHRPSLSVGFQHLEDELQRYINAALMADFEGLALACQQINGNIQHFRSALPDFSGQHLTLLWDWLAQINRYLGDVSNTDEAMPFLVILSDASWPLPIGPEQAMTLLAKLRPAESASQFAADDRQARQQIATDDDVSLALPEDVNQELLDILLQELPVQIRQFSAAMQRLQANGNSKDLAIAQRIAHTIKGSANTVGVTGIAMLTHQIEDILVAFAKEGQCPGIALLSLLSDAADCLESMSESLLGLSEAPHHARTLLQDILDWANRIDQAGIAGLADVAVTRVVNIANTNEQTPTAPAIQDNEPEQAQAAMIRVSSEHIDNLFRLSGESIIMNSQALERLRQLKNQLHAMEQQFDLLSKLGDELEQMIDLKDLSGRRPSTLRPDFDALEMDQYNELHTASRRMVEAAVDAREIGLDAKKDLEQMGELLEFQQRLVIDSQEAVMQTRLVPIATLVPRLQRSLRQTCRLTGKHSQLSISGEHLLIDSNTLNAITDPLMHLLRNAIDHGIEEPTERLAASKPPHGQIAIEFDREGNSILVRCKDDGGGLDFAAIRAAAEKKGSISPEAILSEDDLKRFILRPNFSTRSQTTQTSGRGVGMDVVNDQIKRLGGSLTLHSAAGQGLVVELKIPLPLSRVHALLANIGSYRVTITSKGLKQAHFPSPEELSDSDCGPILTLDGQSYPLINLRSLLHIPDNRKQNCSQAPVLLIENEGSITAVQVDAISASLDVVIKNFGHYFKKILGFAGAAILGDGSVAPVLDVPELLRSSLAHSFDASHYQLGDVIDEPAQSLPTVLVVDDSLSQRRALEQLLKDVGFQTRTARDGIEAVEMLALFRPDIVLTDLEMPRMNGIELSAHIRSKVHLHDLPVIMITSRTTQKHREMAEAAGTNFYLTKPVREDDLISKIVSLIGATASERS